MMTATPAAAMDIRGLTSSYGGAPVVWNVTARFPEGHMSAIVGPNGSGKSTLIRSALGIHPIDSGRVSVLGTTARSARRDVAYVPQRDEVDWDFPRWPTMPLTAWGSALSHRARWVNCPGGSGSGFSSRARCARSHASSSWTSPLRGSMPARRVI